MPFKETKEVHTCKMETVHADIVGPFPTPSVSGKRYASLYTDDATRWTEIYFLTAKSEVPDSFREYKAKMERYGKIRNLRTDGGGEYGSNEFERYLALEGIVHQITAAYSPASNGILEWANRRFLEPTRCMLRQAGMPDEYWAEAARAAVYLGNRIEHRHVGSSPYESMTGVRPNLSHARIFGCLAQAMVQAEEGRKKLDSWIKEMVFIGYTETTSIWRLLDRGTLKVHRSRDVAFKKDEFPFARDTKGIRPEPPTVIAPEMQDSDEETIDDLEIIINSNKRPVTDTDLAPHEPKRRTVFGRDDLSVDMNWQPASENAPRSTRSKAAPVPFGASIADAANALISRELPAGPGVTVGAQTIYDFAYMATEGPRTYEQALRSEQAEKWKEAFASEMKSLKDHRVFSEEVYEESDLKVKEKLVDGKFALTIKHVDGTPGRYKARQIARGFTQRPRMTAR